MLTKERNSERRGNGNGISVARDLEPCSLKYGLTPEESDSIALKESSVAPTREREVSAKAESERDRRRKVNSLHFISRSKLFAFLTASIKTSGYL